MLVAGGWNDSGALRSAALYDPRVRTFVEVGALLRPFARQVRGISTR